MTIRLEPPNDQVISFGDQADHARQASSIRVSIDLVKAAKVHRQFLKTVSGIPDLLRDTPLLRNATRRYETIWIPLLKEHSGRLTAPIDVDFVWHCHQLNPVQHLQYLKAKGVKPADATRVLFESADEARLSLEETKRVWKEKFPTEPFELSSDQSSAVKADRDCNNELLHACLRQNDFYHQIEPFWYSETNFLNESVARYKEFLHLLKMHPEEFLTPTYDIDLMWHTHMRYAECYREDMMLLFGYVLDHDDKDSDRSEGSKLAKGWQRTDELWNFSYGKSQRVPGTLYRGKGGDDSSLCVPGKEYEYLATYDLRDHLPTGGSDNVIVFNVVTASSARLSYCETLRLRFRGLRWQLYMDMTHTYEKTEGGKDDTADYTPRKLTCPGDCCNYFCLILLTPLIVAITIFMTLWMPLFGCCEIAQENDSDYTVAELTNFESFKAKWARMKASGGGDTGGGCGGGGCGGGCGG